MNYPFAKDDIVTLVRDLAGLGLVSGQIGKVLGVNRDSIEVVFPKVEGEQHLIVQTLTAEDVEKAMGLTALAGPADITRAEALHKLQHSMHWRTYKMVKLLLGLDAEAYIDYDAETGGLTIDSRLKAADLEQVLTEQCP